MGNAKKASGNATKPILRPAAGPQRGAKRSSRASVPVIRLRGSSEIKGRCVSLFLMPGVERVDQVKKGVPPQFVYELAKESGATQERVAKRLGLSLATVNRKIRLGLFLSTHESELVVGLARLIGQVQKMVEYGGVPAGFSAAHWVVDWLDQPLPALGGHTPGEYMDTAAGQQVVEGIIEQACGGAFS